MIFKPLAYSSLLLSMLCLSLTGNFIIHLSLGLAAFFCGFLSIRKNASSVLSFSALILSGLTLGLIFYLKTVAVFIPVAFFLASIENNFKITFLKFNYTRWLWIEPLMGATSITLYIVGNLQSDLGWAVRALGSLPIASMGLLTFINLYGRSTVARTSKSYVKVGQKAPEFSLPDENGELVSLAQFRGTVVLVVFVRGDWCPGCHIMMRTYEKHREALQQKGVTLLCIGPDPVGVNKEMARKIGVNYRVLSDEGQKVVIQYTVELMPPAPNVPKSYVGIPLPASFLIDKDGQIRHTSRIDNAGEILGPQVIFDVLDKL